MQKRDFLTLWMKNNDFDLNVFQLKLRQLLSFSLNLKKVLISCKKAFKAFS